MKPNWYYGLSAISLASSLAVSTPAIAQETTAGTAEGTAITDILVTARRREESLQDVPVAVTAFSSETIEALSVKQVNDIANVTPNLTRTAGPTDANDAFFFIRGIGQVDSNPAADPGVGVYIDGVYLARLQGASVDAFDLQRLEVLRGPQGTLFGRNTIGGAISLTTTDPGSTYGFRGRVTAGSRNRLDIFGAVDLPVTDSFAIRLSGGFRQQDGWGTNVYTGEQFSSIENLSGRLKAVWNPTENLKLTMSADWLRGRGTTSHTILRAFNLGGGQPVPGATPLGVFFPPDINLDRSSDLSRNFASVDPRNDIDNRGVSATIEYDLGDVTAKLILARRAVDQFATNDFDGTGYRFYENFFDTSSRQTSAELQFLGTALGDRLDYLVGLYGFDEDIDNNNSICLGGNLGGPFAFARNTGGCLRNNQIFNLQVQSIAAFGQASYKFTPELSLTLGGRYTSEKKVQAFDFFIDNSAGVFSIFGFPPLANIPTLSPRNPANTVPTTYSKTFNQFTPKIGIDYQASDDLLIYASFSKGFKSGGFNGRPNPGPTGFLPITPYAPEKLDAYELGLKSEFLDGRVRINAAVFHSIYKDIQLLVLDPGSGFFNTANAGKSEINGFEVETTIRPVSAFTLYANVGYTHDQYKQLDANAIISGILPGNRLPVTPRWTLGLGAAYEIDLGSAGSLTPRADYSYRSSVFYGAGNAPLEFEGGVGLLNLRATWSAAEDRFSISAFVLNATKKRYFTNTQDVRSALGVAFSGVSAPREWGIEGSIRF